MPEKSKSDALAQKWLDATVHPRTKKPILNQHETLDALATFAAHVIYNCADDHGAALAALERQFMERLHATVADNPHDAGYHDATKQH